MVRENAITDLRQLAILRAAISGAISKEGSAACRKVERMLRDMVQSPLKG